MKNMRSREEKLALLMKPLSIDHTSIGASPLEGVIGTESISTLIFSEPIDRESITLFS